MKVNRFNKVLMGIGVFTASVGAFSVLISGTAHAATVNVSGSCPIEDAITSLNNGADENSCTSSGTYGTDDAITIPAGTYSFSADLPTLTVPATIQGAGMNQTTLDGGGSYNGLDISFAGSPTDKITIKDMKIFSCRTAIRVNAPLAEVQRIDVDGTNVGGSDANGIVFDQQTPGSTNDISVSDVYIHDFSGSHTIVNGFVISNHAQGITTTAALENITVANIENSTGSINAFLIATNVFSGFSTGNATITAQIDNTTVSNLNASNGAVAGFGGVAIAVTGTHLITLNTRNTTSVGVNGSSTAYGPSAAFFAAGAGVGAGSSASTVLNTVNSLVADNLSDGSPANCAALDITSVFGGSGTGSGTINSLGHNISDDTTCTDFIGTGDQQNLNNIISTLGPLQNNGGFVPTRALLPGSPAIGAGGQVLGISTDARGIARSASSWDVGAYQTVLGAQTGSGSEGGSQNTDSNGNLSKTGQGISLYLLLILGLSVAGIVQVQRKKL